MQIILNLALILSEWVPVTWELIKGDCIGLSQRLMSLPIASGEGFSPEEHPEQEPDLTCLALWLREAEEDCQGAKSELLTLP